VVVWAAAVGTASYEDERDATPETQYRIGSITKTFTATAVMQLRDAGLLDLDDRLDEHVGGVRVGSPTIRRLLAHLSGFQREPGEMWVSGEAPTIEELLAAMDTYELVLPAARAHHYSNLAYALLGELVARRSGKPYAQYVDDRILQPLGLARTTWVPQEPYAQGYLVDEYAGTVHREPHTDLRGAAAMGQLWSTVGDLCTWASFLARGRGGVLDASTVEEMWFPQVLVNPDRWERGWGLGLELLNRDGRISNSGTRAQTSDLVLELATITLEQWRWTRSAGSPNTNRRLRSARSSAAGVRRATSSCSRGAPSWIQPSVFEAVDGGYRVVTGRERGERMRVDGDRLIWAGYLFTRTQLPFASDSWDY